MLTTHTPRSEAPIPSPGSKAVSLSTGIPSVTVIVRKPCDVTIPFLLDNRYKIGTLQWEADCTKGIPCGHRTSVRYFPQ